MNKCTAYIFSLLMAVVLLASCNPEAQWTTKDVTVSVDVKNVSAGFAECLFSTDKEAYYFVGITPVIVGFNPMDNPKSFMTLAIDSAYTEYLQWRNILLHDGEFNIAPFASHTLQYGNVDYFFTGLQPDTDYWIYAFVMNPDKLTPSGKLYLETVRTKEVSNIDIHFEYRVKGYWDYVYPMDSLGNICTWFPYVATTCDSLTISESGMYVEDFFSEWLQYLFDYPSEANLLYGVKAVENDGYDEHICFEEDHTYYTAIAAFDGPVCQSNVIYKFTWHGEDTQYYFREYNSE